MPEVDLVLSGSVAVTESGHRVGKGEGYADLEFALLAEFDRVGPATTVVTTVHPMQVVPDGVVTPDAHDVPLDLIVTSDRTVETRADRGELVIDWDALDKEKRREIPLLNCLYSGRQGDA